MYQVYRLSPIIGKHYEYAEADVNLYLHPQIYTSSTKPVYVGKYLYDEEFGYGDNKVTIYHFNNQVLKTIIKIRLSYEGRSCFREVKGINENLLENRWQMLSFLKGSKSNNSSIQHLDGFNDIVERIGKYVFTLPYTCSVKPPLN